MLNGFKYCNLTQIIQFDINPLFADGEVLQLLLFNTNNSIEHYSFANSQMAPGIAVKPIFQFRYAVKEFQVLIFNTNNSIKYYSFICTQLNGSRYCLLSLTI